MLPNPDTSAFNLANTLALAKCAMLAYETPAVVEAALPLDTCSFRFIDDPATDSQCFVAADDRACVVAFRGTSTTRDFWTDLRCGKRALDTHDAAPRVHEGFLDAWQSLEPAVRAALREVPEHVPVFFTGHSLGGALAHLAAFDLRYAAAAYTFGQPRVGNGAFARESDAAVRLHRLVHEEDPVARLPLYLMGYRHAGEEVFLPSFGARLTFDPPLRYKLLSDVWGIIDGLANRRMEIAQDHFVAQYVAALQVIALNQFHAPAETAHEDAERDVLSQP